MRSICYHFLNHFWTVQNRFRNQSSKFFCLSGCLMFVLVFLSSIYKWQFLRWYDEMWCTDAKAQGWTLLKIDGASIWKVTSVQPKAIITKKLYSKTNRCNWTEEWTQYAKSHNFVMFQHTDLQPYMPTLLEVILAELNVMTLPSPFILQLNKYFFALLLK